MQPSKGSLLAGLKPGSPESHHKSQDAQDRRIRRGERELKVKKERQTRASATGKERGK